MPDFAYHIVAVLAAADRALYDAKAAGRARLQSTVRPSCADGTGAV